MNQHPEVGDRAPTFELPSTSGEICLTEQLSSGPVLIIFYPPDASAAAVRLLSSYRDQIELFEELGVAVFGVNSDRIDSHEALIAGHKLPFPLLSDEDGEVARSYGAASASGAQKRVLVVIGNDGRVWFRDALNRIFPPRPADVAEMIAKVWS